MGLNILDIATWWIVLEIIGLAALPLALYTGRNLKDNGYSISKPLGLVLLTYTVWMLTNLGFKYSTLLVLISLAFIGLMSLVTVLKNGIPDIQKHYIIKFEILFALGFLVFSVIRAYSPDIYWIGGEKFMDMTFINSFLRTEEFPPLDPWMSGNVIPYYYFGYLIVSALIKITGVFPSVAFNLSTASFFALSLTTAFGIGYNLTGKSTGGLLTAFFVNIAGNFSSLFQLIDVIIKDDILSFNYWTSSRVIPGTINEFPYFSFLQGDVHAHMISITFQLFVLLLLIIVLVSGIDTVIIFILGLSIGFLYPLNTWDYPVYLFLAVTVIGIHFLISGKFSSGIRKNIKKPVSVTGSLVFVSYLLYLPYHLSYTLDRTISFVPSGRTELIYYAGVFGLLLIFIFSFVLERTRKLEFKPGGVILFLILISIFSVVLDFQLLILLVPLLVLSIMAIMKENDKNIVYVLVLIITGILLSLFCELFYIQDALGSGNPDLIRLNTVFKLYMQNWILWGVSAGFIVFTFRDSFEHKKVFGVAAVILILVASIYPVFGTLGKSWGFRGDPDLNGEEYVKKEHHQEYMAVLWFRNITGRPVVLQAGGELYKWNTHIPAFTGLPTVIGWAGHELNWRFPHREDVDTRWSDVNQIYSSSDPWEVNALLKKYNVSYIYYGYAEYERFGVPVLFDTHPEQFEIAFQYGDVVVYKVRKSPGIS